VKTKAKSKAAKPRLSEREFQAMVIRLARLAGWRVAHFRPAQTASGWRTPVEADGSGWPDLVLVPPARLVRRGAIFAELKVGKGRLTVAQEEWQKALRAAGLDAVVWRETMWGEIEDILTGRANP
jgi:hypothetical protein